MESIVKQPLRIIQNTIPRQLIGVRFYSESGVRFNNVPPVKDNTYFSLVELSLFLVGEDGKDIGQITAEKQFYWKATMAELEAIEIIYSCYLETISEYNSTIRQLNIPVLVSQNFQSPPRETILNNIIASLRFNSLN